MRLIALGEKINNNNNNDSCCIITKQSFCLIDDGMCFFLPTERPNGIAKRGRWRRQFYQTAVRHHSTDHAPHPTADSHVHCAEECEREELVEREELERSTTGEEKI